LEDTARKLNNEWRSSAKPPFGPLIAQPDNARSEGSMETPTTASSPGYPYPNNTPPESPTIYNSEVVPSTAMIHLPSRQDMYLHSRMNSHPTTSGYELVPHQSTAQQDSIHEMVRNLLSNLNQRGTGQHLCPYGTTCTKGGLENGRLKVFERNSAFRFDEPSFLNG
jgi:hypothetical protein